MPRNIEPFCFGNHAGTIKQLIQKLLKQNVLQVSANMETVGNQGIDHNIVDPIKARRFNAFLNSKANAGYFLQDKSGSQ
jgi:ATP-dependent RNA helicase DeaD